MTPYGEPELLFGTTTPGGHAGPDVWIVRRPDGVILRVGVGTDVFIAADQQCEALADVLLDCAFTAQLERRTSLQLLDPSLVMNQTCTLRTGPPTGRAQRGNCQSETSTGSPARSRLSSGNGCADGPHARRAAAPTCHRAVRAAPHGDCAARRKRDFSRARPHR